MAVEEEFAKEIAKQLPVKAAYEDAIQPVTRPRLAAIAFHLEPGEAAVKALPDRR